MSAGSGSELTLQVLTPEGLLLEADHLREVIVPLSDGGTIGIRPKHAPLIAETVDGPVRFLGTHAAEAIALMAGVLQVRDNVVSILTAGTLDADLPPVVQDQDMAYTRLIQTLAASLERDETVGEDA